MASPHHYFLSALQSKVNMKTKLLVCVSLCTVMSLFQSLAAQQPSGKATTSGNPLEPVLPYSPSLDLTSMDKSVDPCVDFYQYSCGGWQKKNPIPNDQVSWSVYGKLYQDNLIFLRGILEQAGATQTKKPKDAVTQKIGDFYAACMDETAVEKRGITPLQPDLDAIDKLKSAHDLAPLVARLQLVLGGGILFSSGSRQDPDDSDQQIAAINQGGLGLPDRDYYVKDD